MATAKSLYQKLESDRDHYLSRARAAAALTIPSLFPDEGHEKGDYHVPYQGTGARAVKSLAAKLLLAMFPPNTPFFKMSVDESEIGVNLPDATKGEIEEALMSIESMVSSRLEQKAARTKLYEGLKQLLVGGNTLLYVGKDALKLYRLDKYVVKRDHEGKVELIIIKEAVDKDNLTEEQAALVTQDPEADTIADDNTVNVYTIIRKAGKRYKLQQEIGSNVVEGSQSTYKPEALPWIALRMIANDGEDYGRSYVEEHMGDLHGLESLTKSLTEASAAAARILFLVKPNSAVKIKQLREAPNGDFIAGNRDDVQALQLDKFADLRMTTERISILEQALAQSFLMTSSVQRDAERVTAEEIRTLTNELEATLGGVYSLLALELQLPLVSTVVARLQDEKKIEKLPEGIKPRILTGVEAMGRSSELQKLQMFLNFLQPMGQDVIPQYLNVEEYMKRLATATNLDTKGLIKTEEERQQEQNQNATMNAAMQAAPQMMRK
jgi:hypothetical protein